VACYDVSCHAHQNVLPATVPVFPSPKITQDVVSCHGTLP